MKNKALKNVTPGKPENAVEIVKNEFGLTPAQAGQAAELAAKCPAIVSAHGQLKELESGLRDRYFILCEAIRETQLPLDETKTRGLNRREVTLLLQGLGYAKQRITEINRVVEVPPELWAQFKARAIGFRATLQLARAKDEPEGTAGGEGQGEGGDEQLPGMPPPPPPKPAPKLSKAVLDQFVKVLAKYGAAIKTNEEDESYEFTYANDGRKYSVRLFVDNETKTKK